MKNKLNYGIDAPEIIRNRIIVGVVFIVLAIGISKFYQDSIFIFRLLLTGIISLLAFTLIFSSIMMLLSSKFGKLKEVNMVLDMLNIKGDEYVLDAGCGKGLYLIGIAKRLIKGKVVGIDKWTKDLSNNCKENTLLNAKIEGVIDKVKIRTGDMTKIPYEEKTFDLIISSFVINNILEESMRKKALLEIVRVLKNGGKLCIIDMKNIDEYINIFKENGILDISITKSKYIYPRAKIIIGTKTK
ncbi:class I SAM-dependent methyltransferase [Romboutsia sp.]|uniref:class I SAM-dependent methyltransferase n=1 Tax=Romboutsia sp. TaxID=1965302 RepID=UPI003F3DBF26